MTRDAYSSADVSTVAPGDFLDEYSGHIKQFYDAAAFPLTGVAGVNDLTATLSPALDGDGLVTGMRVSVSAPAAFRRMAQMRACAYCT